MNKQTELLFFNDFVTVILSGRSLKKDEKGICQISDQAKGGCGRLRKFEQWSLMREFSNQYYWKSKWIFTK